MRKLQEEHVPQCPIAGEIQNVGVRHRMRLVDSHLQDFLP